MNELYLQATKYAVDKLKKQATHARQNEYKKENSSTFV